MTPIHIFRSHRSHEQWRRGVTSPSYGSSTSRFLERRHLHDRSRQVWPPTPLIWMLERDRDIIDFRLRSLFVIPSFFLSPLVCLPQINRRDIYIYLVHNPSPYSGDILKAFKSTDAYQYAVAGWVKDAKVRHLATNNLYLIRAKLSTIYLWLLVNCLWWVTIIDRWNQSSNQTIISPGTLGTSFLQDSFCTHNKTRFELLWIIDYNYYGLFWTMDEVLIPILFGWDDVNIG